MLEVWKFEEQRRGGLFNCKISVPHRGQEAKKQRPCGQPKLVGSRQRPCGQPKLVGSRLIFWMAMLRQK